MERFKVFDVLHHEHLSLISLSLPEPSSLPGLFERLEGKEIKIKFLVSHITKTMEGYTSYFVLSEAA